MPLSRAGVSFAARVGAQLFRYLFQFAWREDVADVFTAGSYAEIRSAALDDFGTAGLVCGGVSAHDFTLASDHARAGETAPSARWALVSGWMSGAGGEKALTVKALTTGGTEAHGGLREFPCVNFNA